MHKISKTFISLFILASVTACSVGNETYFAGNDHVQRHNVVAETSKGTFNISYLTSGSAGRRVIVLHGTPGAADDYYRFIRSAPDDIEYLVIDRPGYGETTPHKLVASLEAQADALVPLLIEKKWPETNCCWPFIRRPDRSDGSHTAWKQDRRTAFGIVFD